MDKCEGFRRYGGAFTLGPARWEQCTNTPTVLLTVEAGEMPACHECWKEALDGGVVKSVRPLAADPEVK